MDGEGKLSGGHGKVGGICFPSLLYVFNPSAVWIIDLGTGVMLRGRIRGSPRGHKAGDLCPLFLRDQYACFRLLRIDRCPAFGRGFVLEGTGDGP